MNRSDNESDGQNVDTLNKRRLTILETNSDERLVEEADLDNEEIIEGLKVL